MFIRFASIRSLRGFASFWKIGSLPLVLQYNSLPLYPQKIGVWSPLAIPYDLQCPGHDSWGHVSQPQILWSATATLRRCPRPIDLSGFRSSGPVPTRLVQTLQVCRLLPSSVLSNSEPPLSTRRRLQFPWKRQARAWHARRPPRKQPPNPNKLGHVRVFVRPSRGQRQPAGSHRKQRIVLTTSTDPGRPCLDETQKKFRWNFINLKY